MQNQKKKNYQKVIVVAQCYSTIKKKNCKMENGTNVVALSNRSGTLCMYMEIAY